MEKALAAHSPATVPVTELGHHPALDGLRGIHVLLVILYHTHLVTNGAFLSIDNFFVLSGFLITTLLLGERERTGQIKLRYFYMRRFLRILPGVFAMVLLSMGYFYWREPQAFQLHLPAMWGALFYYANFLLAAGRDLGAFTHTWSLSVEEQFYLWWPTALYFLLPLRHGRRWLIALCVTGLVAVAIWRFVLFTQFERPYTHLLYGTDTRLDVLLAGCLLSLIWQSGWRPATAQGRQLGWVITSFGTVVLLWYYFNVTTISPLLYQYGGFTVVALCNACLMWGLLEYPFKLARLLLENSFILWCGQLSYGLYLWHVPVIYWFKTNTANAEAPANLLVIWLVTFALGSLSFYGLEQPCIRLKRYFSVK